MDRKKETDDPHIRRHARRAQAGVLKTVRLFDAGLRAVLKPVYNRLSQNQALKKWFVSKSRTRTISIVRRRVSSCNCCSVSVLSEDGPQESGSGSYSARACFLWTMSRFGWSRIRARSSANRSPAGNLSCPYFLSPRSDAVSFCNHFPDIRKENGSIHLLRGAPGGAGGYETILIQNEDAIRVLDVERRCATTKVVLSI